MKHWLRCAALLVVVLSLSACYGYMPVRSPQNGMEVRARLKGEAAAKRSAGLDDPVIRYDGVVVESTPEELKLDVLIARSSSAVEDVVMRDTVRIELSEIQSLQQRKLSVPRTVLFVIAAGAAAYGAVAGIQEVVGGTGDDKPPGDPTFSAPLFSWQTLRVLFAGVGRR